MLRDTTHFQYCQKTVIYSKDLSSILLAKRKGEADYNEVFTFVCGKMETTDGTIVAGIKREIEEELGSDVRLSIYPTFTINKVYTKKDGNGMILPHIFTVFEGGEIELNEEYSDYVWVPVFEINDFGPIVDNIPEVVHQFLKVKDVILKTEKVDI